MTIGERIRKLREDRGLVQRNVGMLLLGDKSTPASAQGKQKRIEAGLQELTVSEVFILANYFKVSPLWLMTGDETLKIDVGENTYPYKDKNKSVHEDVEIILNSDNEDVVNAFKISLKGVMLTLKESGDVARLLKEMAKDIEQIKASLRSDDTPEEGGGTAGVS